MRLKRTRTCGALRGADAGARVVLGGWVASRRDHGGIRFIDLRDRYGVTQVVVDESSPPDAHAVAAELRDEYCLAVAGTVRLRPADMANPQQATGEIELAAEEIEVLSACDPLPFAIGDTVGARESCARPTATSTCAPASCSAIWPCAALPPPRCAPR